MALVLADRVQETTTSTGTGAVILAGAVNGYQTFSAGVGNGNTCYYTIYDNTSFAWEVGIGTFTTSPNTLTRNTILSSSNSGSAVNLAGNTAAVWVDMPAERIAYVGNTITAMNLASPTIVGGTINNAVIGGTTAAAGTFTTATVGTLSATSLTSTAASFGTIVSGTWNGGIVGLAYGGTNASLVATAGASVYSTGTALALTTAGQSGQPLVSGGSGAPTFVSTLNLSLVSSTAVTIPNQSLTATLNTAPLAIGPTLSFSDTGIAMTSTASINSYYQNVIQNTNSGTQAAAEFAVYNNNGTATTNFGVFGMNSSGYTGSGAANSSSAVYMLSGSTDLVIGAIGSNNVHFVTGGSTLDAVTINSTSAVAFNNSYGSSGQYLQSNGSASPPTWVSLSVSSLGSTYISSLGVGTAASGTTGEIRATNNITAYYSDERLKTKVGNIENALDKVTQIETMIYHANETAVGLGYDASIVEVGVTAQSVQKVQPEVVVPAPIDEQYLTVRYEKLVPLLIEAIKELKAEVDALKGK